MRQLRPHLADPADFTARVRRMAAQRYRLLGAWRGDEPLALAGYRLDENLIYGSFLYVDDLVTHEVQPWPQPGRPAARRADGIGATRRLRQTGAGYRPVERAGPALLFPPGAC